MQKEESFEEFLAALKITDQSSSYDVFRDFFFFFKGSCSDLASKIQGSQEGGILKKIKRNLEKADSHEDSMEIPEGSRIGKCEL